jgi:hypothetical protein
VCFQTGANLLLWSIEDSTISDGVREKSSSSKEDILRIYFDEKYYMRR